MTTKIAVGGCGGFDPAFAARLPPAQLDRLVAEIGRRRVNNALALAATGYAVERSSVGSFIYHAAEWLVPSLDGAPPQVSASLCGQFGGGPWEYLLPARTPAAAGLLAGFLATCPMCAWQEGGW